MHPNDPPVKNMRRLARIFHHTDGLRRLIQEIPNPFNGITFCQGTITAMGVDVFKQIRYFAGLNRIKLVHVRSVRGTVPKYTEVFVDEGDIDMLEAMKTYRDAGYEGPFVSDHPPPRRRRYPLGSDWLHLYARLHAGTRAGGQRDVSWVLTHEAGRVSRMGQERWPNPGQRRSQIRRQVCCSLIAVCARASAGPTNLSICLSQAVNRRFQRRAVDTEIDVVGD